MCTTRVLLWLALLLVLLPLVACQPIQAPPATAPALPTGADVVEARAAPEPTATATDQATASVRPTRAPRVKLTAEHQKLTSQALAGNLLGDPIERGFKQEPTDLSKLSELPIETRWEIAMAAAIAPNPDKPPFFLDMPYVRETGQAKVAPGFVEKLEASSPVQDAEHYLQQPLRLRGILVYHGRQDDMAPVGIVRDFSALLTELGIEHVYLEVDAMHCNMDLEPILKFMSEHLMFEERAQ